ncbi:MULTISPECIES: hypothetical protein [Bacillus]|uniref:hypothetical protein n=1 Tax=Bacillus TaxID=1386 RepID=UPI000352BBDD|nr:MULTISPECIES: hypothetical protein [Bacillus]EPF03466.1 hypothetical protein ICQ_04863 [Bacillus toyonensis]MCH5469824.1 hypothetical protein [Bacillus toyonensis]MCU4826999.1 hypothetical protein [Bacillus toyonensis]PGD80287.1 hypothetical protein COM36_20870 [Bacillus toyonensis]PHA75389.1 hypothetical protein COE71_16995 [Bacillus toyonensis]
MLKITGVIRELQDGEQRSVTVSPGSIKGDDILELELMLKLAYLQREKAALGPEHYLPKGDYNQDVEAIAWAARMILTDMKVEDDWSELG